METNETQYHKLTPHVVFCLLQFMNRKKKGAETLSRTNEDFL